MPRAHASGRNARDPIAAEIIRHSLNSAAEQMKTTLIRTAFSPTVYDQHDFAVTIYDRHLQLLAQAPTIPLFMGTMSFCVQAAVEAVGGAAALVDGDVIVYNWPYGTGSHAQDVAVIAPIFHESQGLVGYAATKAHQRDIGAKDPYCTDTTDVFQEGVIIPGVKLWKAGVQDAELTRMIVANSRAPHSLTGDLQAQVTSAMVGVREVKRIMSRFTPEDFWTAVDQIYDHGEATIRQFFSQLPDGRYVGRSSMDGDGVSDESIPIEVVVEIRGSEVSIDYSGAPDATVGPVNCPLPSTVSASIVAITMLAGGGEAPNEGHFRPVKVVTRPGSLFHPVAPQPCYLYGWSAFQAMDAILQALAEPLEGRAPSGCAWDICATHVYVTNPVSGDLEKFSTPMSVGQGAHAMGDGGTAFVPALSNSRFVSVELEEARFPVRYEKAEFVADSGGAGQYQGGLGWERRFRVLRDAQVTSLLERTKEPSWGQAGGLAGLTNRFTVCYPDGTERQYIKKTRFPIPAGAELRVRAGGGGGYGPPAQRAVESVLADLENEYITRTFAFRLSMLVPSLCSPVVFSQESTQLGTTLEEILVTAERRSTNLQETPLAISAFDGDDLKLRSITDATDLQYLVPGLTVGTKGQIARITMRGIGMENVLGGSIGGDPGVSYNVNGVVYARPQMTRPGFFDVDRVEVLRGPQGTLYGRNATGGSIKVITREPTPQLTGNADVTLGNRGTVQFEGGVGGPLVSDQVLGRVAVRTGDYDGDLRNVVTGGTIGSIGERAIRGSLLLNPDGAVKLLLDADYYRNRGTAPSYMIAGNVTGGPTPGETLGGRLLTDQRNVEFNTDGYNTANIWGSSAKLTWDTAATSLTSLTAFRRMYVNEGQDLDGTGALFGNTDFRYNHSHQLSQELQLSSNGSAKLQWVVGGFYFDEDSDAAQQFEFFTFGARFNSGGTVKSTSYAGFGQATYPVLDAVNLTLGARYTVDEKEMTEFFSFGASANRAVGREKWSAFTPRVSVDWHVAPDAMLYATFAKGFKSGGFNIGAIQANAYDPETVRSYEVGAKLRLLSDSVQLNAAAFHYDYSDLQVTQLVGLVAAMRNAAESNIDGVEVETAARITDAAKLTLTYSYLDAAFDTFFNTENAFPALGLQDLSGNPLPRAPQHSLNLGAEYAVRFGIGDLTARVDWSYKSKMYFSEFRRDSVSQDAFNLLDLSLTFTTADESYYTSVFATNLLDEKVWTNVSVNTGTLGFSRVTDINAPRIYGVRAGYRF